MRRLDIVASGLNELRFSVLDELHPSVLRKCVDGIAELIANPSFRREWSQKWR